MSPWNTIRANLLTYTDSAGRLKNTQWLHEILSAVDKIDTIPQIAHRNKNYLLCKYYAAARDSIHFWEQAQQFADHYIINVNIDSLYKADLKHTQGALEIKFHNQDINLKNKKQQEFLRSYISDTRSLLSELLEIRYNAEKYFKLTEDNIIKINQWLKKGMDLYKNNPAYVNDALLRDLNNTRR